jgi:hypothetical protein
VADVLLAQLAAHVRREVLDALEARGRHVDLEEEVHAAAQVEAEIHRQGVDPGEPAGRRRQQVERDGVGAFVGAGVERALDQVLRPELRVGVGEAHLHAGRVDLGAAVVNGFLLEDLFDPGEERRVDLHRRLGARDLHRRRFAEEVRHGIDERRDDHERDERILPGGEAVHY